MSFTRAWGWGVRDGKKRFETCTTATGCRAGPGGGGHAGQLNTDAEDVAVNRSGDVFVADNVNNRIDEFSSAGRFIKAWGWGVRDHKRRLETCTTATGCHSGIRGDRAGQFHLPVGIAVNRSGDVFVADTGNNRIDEFSSAGRFIKAWGWGVRDNKRQFETCTIATGCHSGLRAGHAGAFWQPEGVAVNRSGDVFVADTGNNRIDEFSSAAKFIKAWGWSVRTSLFGHFQICTTATGCFSGVPSGAAGGLSDPEGIAVDRSGDVFVTDSDNHRVDEFSSAGRFIKAWGWDVVPSSKPHEKNHFEICTTATSCQSGIGGPGAGELGDNQDVAVNRSGDVFVTDNVTFNNRVEEFSSAGRFIAAWGWGVLNDKKKFETCTTTCQGGLAAQGAGALSGPTGVAVNGSGDVFVTDEFNCRVNEFRLGR